MVARPDTIPIPPVPIIDGVPRSYFSKTETHTMLGVGRNKFEALFRDFPWHPITLALLSGRSCKGEGPTAGVQFHWDAIQRACVIRAGIPWPTAARRSARRRPASRHKSGAR